MRSLIQIKNLKAGLSSDMSELKVLMIEMLKSSHFVKKMFLHLNTVKKAFVEIRRSSSKKLTIRNNKAFLFPLQLRFGFVQGKQMETFRKL